MWDMEKLWNERGRIDPNKGMSTEMFEWISSMVPVPNVDLLILNEERKVLLSWRDDEYYGRGWHIPGGCIRYKESIAERIERTAKEELGSEVITNFEPIAIREVILGKNSRMPIKRVHHIALLYECRFPDGYNIYNADKEETEANYLKWFSRIPDNVLPVHDVYFSVFRKYGLME